jgi:fumarylacetoacetate (FAA) hydrolase family protein
MSTITLDPVDALPEDGTTGTLVGRVFRPEFGGPAVVAIRGEGVFDVTRAFPTVAELCETADPAAALGAVEGERIGSLADLLAATPPEARRPDTPYVLSPIDLQVIKAAGVTFIRSLLERVIEEQARGDLTKAEGLRAEILTSIGGELKGLKPGSPQAMAVKDLLVERGLWSQYLEVGIGPDAEVFTKAPTLSSVGTGADIGLHPKSTWNNPEPEVVLVVSSQGRIVGATLGNDVNLRDFEGRSALLLSKAKDNNASAAIGPFIRLIDRSFMLNDVRNANVDLEVVGEDGFRLSGHSSMSAIARDPTELVAEACGRHHQYPDGFVLYCGTMFAPIEDRQAPGKGFTHDVGDIVTIRSEKLGALVNRVRLSTEAEPWSFGTRALMRNLAERGLLGGR